MATLLTKANQSNSAIQQFQPLLFAPDYSQAFTHNALDVNRNTLDDSIKDVWLDNFFQEVEHISRKIAKFNYVSMVSGCGNT